jgi:hypothetical protein
MPEKPEMKSVGFFPIEQPTVFSNGFYITQSEATNLADNIEGLKAYIKKLEALIEKMEDYYK